MKRMASNGDGVLCSGLCFGEGMLGGEGHHYVLANVNSQCCPLQGLPLGAQLTGNIESTEDRCSIA